MDRVFNTHSLGVNVKKYRTERHLSAEKLAEMAGISKSHMNNIERDEIQDGGYASVPGEEEAPGAD